MPEETEKIMLENVALDVLVPDPENPRLQTDQGKTRLEKSLEGYGFVAPIIAYRVRSEDEKYITDRRLPFKAGDLLVIVGHQRIIAAREKGFEKVPVVIFPFRSIREARAYNIADNKLGEMSGWDFPLLKDRLEDIDDGIFNAELTGFPDSEREALMTWTKQEINKEELLKGLPEYTQENKEGIIIHVHFESANDIMKFGKIIGQPVNEKTKAIWFPRKDKEPAGKLVESLE